MAATENLRQRVPHRHVATGGFLQGLEPMDRNALLAWHESHCKRIKYDIFMSRCRERQRQQHEEQEQANAFSLSSQQSTKASTSHGSKSSTMHSVSGIGSNLVMKKNSKKRNQQQVTTTTSITNMSSNSNAVLMLRLNEPYALRMSIYEKLAIHLQHFYNEQDILSIESLIIYPMCEPTIFRTLLFWESTSNNSILSSIDRQKSRKLSLLKTITIQGSQSISDACAHIFETLPDCMIVYHTANVTVRSHEDDDADRKEGLDTKDLTFADKNCSIPCSVDGSLSRYRHRSRGITVRVPYSYFFQMPSISLSVESSRDSSEESIGSASTDEEALHATEHVSSNTMPTTTSSTTLVDVELHGCMELFFDSDVHHSIAEIYDHLALPVSTSTSHPAVTMQQVMEYMSFS